MKYCLVKLDSMVVQVDLPQLDATAKGVGAPTTRAPWVFVPCTRLAAAI